MALMNAVSHCCVKANFIKAAKDNWVPCEVRLLTDDIDTFLCVKSRPLGFGQTEEDLKSVFSGVSNTGTISSANQLTLPSVAPVARAFTALCNLSEYKSCTVVTVSVNEVGFFALKLVPAGIFGNKRLYLAMASETECTTWMSMIKANLGKRKKALRNNLTQSRDSLVGTLRPSESHETLRCEPTTNTSTNRYDLDIDTIDNEVYEPCSAQDLIPAVIQQRGDWEKLRLSKMDCFLRLTDDRLELLDQNGERVLHWFPYLLIRRFGAVGGVLRVDAGRRCSTGDGHFFFTCTPSNGQPVDAIVSQIRQLALEAKQRLRQEQATRQQKLHQHGFQPEGGSGSFLPPPVPAKSKRSSSPKGDAWGSTSITGTSSGTSDWWLGGSYKRASSTPARRQADDSSDKMSAEKLDGTKGSPTPSPDGSAGSFATTADGNGVFIASPGKAVPLKEVNGFEPTSANPTPDSSNVTSDGNDHQQQLYDNVAPSSERKTASQSGLDGWRLGSGLKPARVNSRRLETTDLPPAPPPPTTVATQALSSRNGQGSITHTSNGFNSSDKSEKAVGPNGLSQVDNQPPEVAPKPSLVSYSPKSFDLSSYRKEAPKFSWLSNMRQYRPYKEEGEAPKANGAESEARAEHRSPPSKCLSFGSGVYESEETSGATLLASSNGIARLNMRDLDEVLQELRDANQNVTSAVQAAERQRRTFGFSSPHHVQTQQQQAQSPPPSSSSSSQQQQRPKNSSLASKWSLKRDI